MEKIEITSLAFYKLLKEHNLNPEELSADIREAISDVKEQLNGVNLQIKTGRDYSNSLNKLKRRDAFAVSLILAHVDAEPEPEPGTGGNEPPAGGSTEPEPVQAIQDERGYAADKELADLYKAQKTTLTMLELKAMAPICEGVIFSNYEAGAENGIETSHFRLVENSPGAEQFTLSKL